MSHLHHILHSAHKASESGHHKAAGVVYVIVGLFLTPFLIGVPILLYGIYKICK